MRERSVSRWRFCVFLALVWHAGAQAITCNVSSGSIAFGVYNPASPSNRDTTGSVTITCDKNFTVTMSLGVGNGAGATYAGGRRMTRAGGSTTLTYNLYANAGRTQIFGNGTGGSVTLDVSGKKSQSQTIWARIPGTQPTVIPGSYADTVIATISY